MALSDVDILRYIKDKKMIISPFKREYVKGNGVDLRIGNTIARFVTFSSTNKVFDSKNENTHEWYKIERFHNSFIILPNERILCHTLEYLKLPEDIVGFCQLRSTFARIGLSIPPTIVDAGFEGQLTIEITGSSFPVRLYSGQRIIHIIFHKLLTPSNSPYEGKYQKQKGLTLPILSEIFSNHNPKFKKGEYPL